MNVNNIRKILSNGYVLQNEPMSSHTTFRTGGPARLFAVPANAEETAALIRYLNSNGLPYYIVGNGSNLLVSDKGYDGIIIHLGRADDTDFVLLGYEEQNGGVLFDAGCGCLISVLASIAEKLGCTGFEPISGIPGCIGGAALMNAGAYGTEIKDLITEVEVITKEGELRTLDSGHIEFGYRYSSLEKEKFIISRVRYFLPYGEKEMIHRLTAEYAERRKDKQPVELPSAGSTFKRPEGYFAGKLIEDAGLRGYRIGGAMVSDKHCGFIVNKDHATSSEIYQLIRYVQKTVYERSGVRLETEVKLLGDFEDEQ